MLLIIDQWPQWAFVAKRPALHGGFERLLREGEWATAHYPYASTLTAPGHTLLGSGATPSESGIISNEWWDRESQRGVKSVEDGKRFSAHYLRVPGLGDAMAAGTTGGKVVSVSLKDRAAILPIGHHGLALYYDKVSHRWESTSPRPWLAEELRAHPIEPRLAEAWTALDPARLQALSGSIDAQSGEVGEKHFGPTFPHVPASTGDAGDAVFAMPLGNTLVLEMAAAAIRAEGLGVDAAPDLLVMSFSANDYIGHGWGHESWEMWDMTLRLDTQLAQFLADLDAAVGPDGWAMIATSDHGAAPMPERAGGGRFTYDEIERVANAAATRVLGAGGPWAVTVKSPYVFLTAAARALPPARRDAALAAIASAVRGMAGVGRVELTADHAGHCETRTGDDRALCLSIDPERSGELFVLPARHWICQDEGELVATAHGSLWDYDRDVPFIVLPPGPRVPHAAATAPTTTEVDPTTVSSTLAGWLGIPAPSSLTTTRVTPARAGVKLYPSRPLVSAP